MKNVDKSQSVILKVQVHDWLMGLLTGVNLLAQTHICVLLSQKKLYASSLHLFSHPTFFHWWNYNITVPSTL